MAKMKKKKKAKVVEEPQPAAITKTTKSKKANAVEEPQPAAAKTKKSKKAKAVEEAEASEDDDVQYPQYKEDIDAFSGIVEEGKDYISAMPSEILNEILSYLILDHDPDRGLKKHEKQSKGESFQEHSHVLLSLAAMSHHFRAHVDDFSLRYLTKYREGYWFRTTAEREDAQREAGRVPRRSERLKGQPDNRCYRKELVTKLQWHCVGCQRWTNHRSVMLNAVGLCHSCQASMFTHTLTLTEARTRYDLQDWMLIPSRKPHLRAKHLYLPVITYGTARTGTPFCNGKRVVSYRFFEKDVETIAAAVHGNIEEHMQRKEKERLDKKLKKRNIEHRKMKIRYHEDSMKEAQKAGNKLAEKRHRNHLKFYQDPNCDEGYDTPDAFRHYGKYADVHRRLCVKANCEYCERETRMKYSEFWRDIYGFLRSDHGPEWDSEVED